MPPAAISRSSTYFPKICGNTRLQLSVVGKLLLLFGCSDPEVRTALVPVSVHELAGCPVPRSATLELTALGDFAPSNRTSSALPLASSGQRLGFPAHTLALSALVTSGEARFIGYSERSQDAVDILLWPEASPCSLFEPQETDAYPGRSGGQALGYSQKLGLVLAAGGDDAASAAVVGALSFDTRRGRIHVVDARARAVMHEPRAFATVTEFGDKFLVAGGENPVHGPASEGRAARASAEIYDPVTESFEPEVLELVEARSQHAALVLPSGETLLIGGRSTLGAALSLLEVVSPSTRRAVSAGAPLKTGRIAPQAVALSDGRVLVAGGETAEGAPIASFEWLNPDGSPSDFARSDPNLPPRFDRALVAMPGGGALAVGGCAAREPLPGEDCRAWCRRGCPPLDATSGEAYWLSSDGRSALVSLSVAVPRAILLSGSDARPWLFSFARAASGAPDFAAPLAFRFNPWASAFERYPLAETPHFDFAMPAPLALSPDFFVWFEAGSLGPRLRGVRYGARERYASDIGLIATRDRDHPLNPAHLAPDWSKPSTLNYDGVLRFAPASTNPSVFVTDTNYADFDLELELETTDSPELVLLGTEGKTICSWPHAGDPRVRATRRGTVVELMRGASRQTCSVTADRLTVGLSGQETAATSVRSMTLTRR